MMMVPRRSTSLAQKLPHFFARRQCRHQHSPSSRGSSPSTTTLPPPKIDYKDISENLALKSFNAASRKVQISEGAVTGVAQMYEEHKQLRGLLNAKRNARSLAGEKIREATQCENASEKKAALAEATKLKAEVVDLEAHLTALESHLLQCALAIPNDTHPDTPIGPETAATTLSVHGPTPVPADPKRDHVTIGKQLELLDLENASMVTGSSWYYLKNEGALLELALTNYAMSVAREHGFTPVITPDVVRADIASRCGFQPRDNSDPPLTQMYHLETPPSSPELVLSGTAEIPLAGMFANKIHPSSLLPMKMVGLGHSFRAEAGARGRDTHGLYRVHQFTKVELFSVTTQEGSEEMMQEMLRVQKAILMELQLPFRVLNMPTEELGASAYQKYDIEVWMPGRGSWGEVSSLSNCTDYQARRLHIRYRPQHVKMDTERSHSTLPFAHTLNGTAVAIPRLIVALLENHARFDGNNKCIGITMPSVLKRFWIGAWSEEDTRKTTTVASIISWDK